MDEERKALAIVLLFFFLAFGARLALMGIRPLHHDEGVNGYFISNIVEGRGWNYDAVNYHGPSFFYITTLSFLLFGQNVFALRIVPVLFGCLLVLLPFLFRKRLGIAGVAVSAFFLAFSPSLLYYSMDAIHEILFTFFMAASLLLFMEFAEEKKNWMLYVGSACLAFLFATKEAAFIIGPFIVLIAISFAFAKGIRLREAIAKNWQKLLVAFALFLIIYISLFSSFFQNWQGLQDSVKTVTLWGERVVTEKGHDKPFPYYWELLLFCEIPLLAGGIAGTLLAFWKKNKMFCALGIFAVALFFGISAVPYKTPWIVINLLPPLALLSGYFTKEVFDAAEGKQKFILAVALVAVFALVLYSSYYVNALTPAAELSEVNRLVYVQTTMKAGEVLGRAGHAEGRILISIGKESTWPMPWLLRNKKVEYYGEDGLESAEFLRGFEVLIVDRDLGEKVAEKIPEYEKTEFDLRPGTGLTAFFAKK
ncbi:MAG: TIGR03663 family protein [Candidatus Diapherotrites archaeon]|nr:TIGR03663 family protein [Candidatus Diapherotrites archaeon]